MRGDDELPVLCVEMKNKLFICIGVVSLVVILLIYSTASKGEKYWSTMASESMTNVFHFQLSNSWKDIRTSGGRTTAYFSPRKMTEIFRLQEGPKEALQELRELANSRPIPHMHSAGSLLVLERNRRTSDPRAPKFASWWHPEDHGEGLLVRVGTNSVGAAWDVLLFAVERGTNVLLFTHIFINE